MFSDALNPLSKYREKQQKPTAELQFRIHV